jgi:uncharacterized membrane protein
LDIADESLELDEDLGIYRGSQNIRISLLSGEHKGEEFQLENWLENRIAAANVRLKKGMTFIASLSGESGNLRIDVVSHDRVPGYIFALIVFFGALLFIGGKKGLKSAIGLVLTLLGVFYLFLPMMFLGVHPVLAAIILGIAVSVADLGLLNGFGKKTAAAIMGTAIGVAVAGSAALLVGWFANITVYHSEEAETMMVIAKNYFVNPQGILFAGVIIASLGAVMDVAISIASSVWEMAEMSGGNSLNRLFQSGMNVAKDIVGATANTLILAFVGSSISLMVILYIANISFTRLINSDLLGIEILQAISGTLGILGAAPITAYIAAVLLDRDRKRVKKSSAVPPS